jgi:hypothetical protein
MCTPFSSRAHCTTSLIALNEKLSQCVAIYDGKGISDPMPLPTDGEEGLRAAMEQLEVAGRRLAEAEVCSSVNVCACVCECVAHMSCVDRPRLEPPPL